MPNPDNLKNHKWKKGQSGNPKGRPKGAKTFKNNLIQALQSKSEDNDHFSPLVIRLLKLMDAENEQVSLKATLEMVDRLEDTQEDAKMNLDTSNLTDREVITLLRLLKKAEPDKEKDETI